MPRDSLQTNPSLAARVSILLYESYESLSNTVQYSTVDCAVTVCSSNRRPSGSRSWTLSRRSTSSCGAEARSSPMRCTHHSHRVLYITEKSTDEMRWDSCAYEYGIFVWEMTLKWTSAERAPARAPPGGRAVRRQRERARQVGGGRAAGRARARARRTRRRLRASGELEPTRMPTRSLMWCLALPTGPERRCEAARRAASGSDFTDHFCPVLYCPVPLSLAYRLLQAHERHAEAEQLRAQLDEHARHSARAREDLLRAQTALDGTHAESARLGEQVREKAELVAQLQAELALVQKQYRAASDETGAPTATATATSLPSCLVVPCRLHSPPLSLPLPLHFSPLLSSRVCSTCYWIARWRRAQLLAQWMGSDRSGADRMDTSSRSYTSPLSTNACATATATATLIKAARVYYL